MKDNVKRNKGNGEMIIRTGEQEESRSARGEHGEQSGGIRHPMKPATALDPRLSNFWHVHPRLSLSVLHPLSGLQRSAGDIYIVAKWPHQISYHQLSMKSVTVF